MRVPPFIGTADIASALECDNQRARRAMIRLGLARKIGGRWLISASKLREKAPDIYDLLLLRTSESITKRHRDPLPK